ncbi:methylated-DNA--[protein]-cysteine S-methyltransferase [Paraglaciecola sp. 20A4]|uniref:methylated-DNA--[protein]-cysteine S-methyltransferase n=1 Tax=Paraglaciecola sp. 20A4 TaxID=2687288 RepID=UPI001408AED6|nr:methylated-DNA--[protein]-cysteine S-methyltransferase [Paraglaciecola sp. 20A4]
MTTPADCNQSYDYLSTATGLLKITANDLGISAITYVEQQDQPPSSHPLLRKAKQQLIEYFNNEREVFDLPLAAKGTVFQRKVWQLLRDIPYGQTCSYGDIAKRLDNPKAVRAVGSANGRNPISIIVPCHRVIGANGTLTGYAGGLKRKAYLLQLENSLFSAHQAK